MKKIVRIIPILLVLMLFASCDVLRPRSGGKPIQDVEVLPADDPAVSNLVDEEPQGIWNNVLDFEVMEPEALPENVRAWADEKSQVTGRVADRMDDGEYTYILVGLGEQPSGGYDIEIVSINDPEAGKYTVMVKATEPEPDSEVITMITYPFDIVRIPTTNIEFVFVNEDGTNFMG